MPENKFFIHRETGQIFHELELSKGTLKVEDEIEPYTPPKWLVKLSEPNKGQFFLWNIHLAQREDMQGCEHTPEEQAKKDAEAKAELRASRPKRGSYNKKVNPIYSISEKSRKRMRKLTSVSKPTALAVGSSLSLKNVPQADDGVTT